MKNIQPYKTTKVAVRKFKAKLPVDFMYLLSVEFKGNRLMRIVPEKYVIWKNNSFTKNEIAFYIGVTEIFFTGNYSKNTFIRWMQKLVELIKPKKVILKYINRELWDELNTETKIQWLKS